MKRIIFLILIISLLLTGCVRKSIFYLDEDNIRTEEEIKSFIKRAIYENTGDEVLVSLKSKEIQSGCTVSVLEAGCTKSSKIEGSYTYEFVVVNSENENITATVTYRDPFIQENKKTGYIMKVAEKYNIEGYISIKDIYNANLNFELYLNSNFDKYYAYINDSSMCRVFINTSDYDKIDDLIKEFNNILLSYDTHMEYCVYVIREEAEFDKIHFAEYEQLINQYGVNNDNGYIMSEVTKSTLTDLNVGGHNTFFDKELFNLNCRSSDIDYSKCENYDDYRYLIFQYGQGRNGARNQNDHGTFKVFGVS